MKNVRIEDMKKLYAVSGETAENAALPAIALFNEEHGKRSGRSKSGGGSVNVEDLQDALVNAKLAGWAPPRPSPRDALTRAVASVRNKHRSADRLIGNLVGYQITDKTPKDNRHLDYAPQFSVWLENRRVCHNAGLLLNPEQRSRAETLAYEVCSTYRELLDNYSGTVVRRWLADQARRLGCVKIVETGHAYYVPACSVSEMQKIDAVMQDVSRHRVHMIPVADDVQGVEAILAGLEREIAAAVQVAEEALQGGAQLRGRKSQVDQLDAFRTKLEAYERILGRSLDSIASRMDGIRAGLVTSILSDEATTDAMLGKSDNDYA